MGFELLTEQKYSDVQRFESFNTKTSSWLKTPSNIRLLDGVLFADRYYTKVFVYNNSAQTYYNARDF